VHVAGSPLHVPFSKHVLESLPLSSNPGSHDKLHMSPALGPPLSPYSQSIIPLSRVRGSHISNKKYIASHNQKNFARLKISPLMHEILPHYQSLCMLYISINMISAQERQFICFIESMLYS